MTDPHKLRFPRYSLRTLFVMVTFAAFLAATIHPATNRYRAWKKNREASLRQAELHRLVLQTMNRAPFGRPSFFDDMAMPNAELKNTQDRDPHQLSR